MAITFTNKASVFSGTNAASYATDSQTPTADRFQLALVVNVNNLAGDPATPTLSGNGMTWTQISTYLPDNSGTKTRMTLFAGLTGPAPSAGAVTADLGGETQLGCNIIVIEGNSEVDISGGTALSAIVQTVTGTVNGSDTSESITLSALANVNNASVGAFNIQLNEVFTAGAGYTIAQQGLNTGPNMSSAMEYLAPGSTTVNISWTTSAARGGIAVEVKVGTPFVALDIVFGEIAATDLGMYANESDEGLYASNTSDIQLYVERG